MDVPDFTFIIPGIAAPQGSKRHVGRGRLVEMSKRVKPWRELVAQSIIQRLPEGHVPIEGPVLLEITFYLPRPRAARDRPYPHKGGPGDVDKLVRAVGDAITTSGLWKDDSQVVDLIARKRYAPGDATPSTYFAVTEIRD